MALGPPTILSQAFTAFLDSRADAPAALAFRHVGAQTTILPDLLINLATQWSADVEVGKRTADAQVKKSLKQIAWTWPQFEIVLDRLLVDDLWPMPWHHYRDRAKAGGDMTAAKCQIFLSTVKATARAIQKSRDPAFTTMLRLEGWHLYTDSTVYAHYVQARSHTVDPGSWQTWPPLYPGYQSRIEVGAACVFSRFGKTE